MSKVASREGLGSGADCWTGCFFGVVRGSVVAEDLIDMATSMLALPAGVFEGVGDIRLRRSERASGLILFGFEDVVLLLDGLGRAGEELMEEFEEAGGIEGVDVMGGAGAMLRAGTLDDDDRNLRGAGANSGDDGFAGNVVDGGVQDDAVDVGKALEGFKGF